jgi:hypothetical protein
VVWGVKFLSPVGTFGIPSPSFYYQLWRINLSEVVRWEETLCFLWNNYSCELCHYAVADYPVYVDIHVTRYSLCILPSCIPAGNGSLFIYRCNSRSWLKLEVVVFLGCGGSLSCVFVQNSCYSVCIFIIYTFYLWTLGIPQCTEHLYIWICIIRAWRWPVSCRNM